MSRIIKIVTSSLGTFEAFPPPFNLREPDSSENLNLVKSILESAVPYKPDLVLIPETFKTAGMKEGKIKAMAETINGPAVRMLRDCAEEGDFNLIAGLFIKENDKIYNKAVVIARNGEIVGTYSKNFPTEGEIKGGVMPSNTSQIFQLDCARIGVGICFDIHWQRLWEKYHKENAELFCWISAYEGGVSIRKMAINYHTPFISSVMPYFSRIIEINGMDIASTSRWSRIAYGEINLDRELFHTDQQIEKITAIQKKYGNDVTIRIFHEEHMFLLENNIPEKNIGDIIKEFDLVPFKEFIARCTEFRNNYIK